MVIVRPAAKPVVQGTPQQILKSAEATVSTAPIEASDAAQSVQVEQGAPAEQGAPIGPGAQEAPAPGPAPQQ